MKKHKTIDTVRELYFRENVGADASVRSKIKQKQNNIKTFDKHKLNIKQKHTNKPMSNILTSNTAITLVALVITIALNRCRGGRI